MRGGVGVLLALASCGDNGRRGLDASASAEADVRGLVRLTYVPALPDHPRGALPVFFQAADSSLLLATRTSEDGEVTAVVPPDTYVTLIAAVNPLTNRQTVWTYEGVQPGDELVLDTSIQPPTDRVPLELAVPPRAGAAYYQMVTNCDTQQFDGGRVVPASIQFRDCGRGAADILVLTYDMLPPDEENLDAAMLQLGVPVVAGSEVAFPAAYEVVPSSSVSLVNVPSASPFITQYLFGREEWIYFQTRQPTVTAKQASAMFQMPLPTVARMVTDVLPGDGSRLQVWKQPSLQTELDLDAYELPTALDTPHFEPTSNRIVWSEGASRNHANAVLATLSANEAALDWTLYARRSEPVAQFPSLPAEAVDPGLTFSVSRMTSLEIRTDLDVVRQHLLGRATSRLAPIVGETGSISARQHVP